MKILTVIHDYPPHRYIGAELYDHALHKALLKEGHEVNVHTVMNDAEPYSIDGVGVNQPIEGEYDLIITHVDAYQDAYTVQRVYNMRHVPIVGIQHNFSAWTLKDEAFYPFAGLIYNSQHMLDNSGNKTENKVVLIPPTMKPSKVATKGDAIMLVGTTRQKGVGMFTALAQNFPDEKFIGVAGGWGVNHQVPYPNITFVEQTGNLRPYYLQAKTLLVPSQFESWSMVASEAMAYGVNVVTFDDLPGVVENVGGAGTLVPRQSNWRMWKEAIDNPLPTDVIKKQASANYRKHQKQLKDTVTWLEGLASTEVVPFTPPAA